MIHFNQSDGLIRSRKKCWLPKVRTRKTPTLHRKKYWSIRKQLWNNPWNHLIWICYLKPNISFLNKSLLREKRRNYLIRSIPNSMILIFLRIRKRIQVGQLKRKSQYNKAKLGKVQSHIWEVQRRGPVSMRLGHSLMKILNLVTK